MNYKDYQTQNRNNNKKDVLEKIEYWGERLDDYAETEEQKAVLRELIEKARADREAANAELKEIQARYGKPEEIVKLGYIDYARVTTDCLKDVLEDMAAKIVCGIDPNADYLKKYLQEAAGYLSDFYFTMGNIVSKLAIIKKNNN